MGLSASQENSLFRALQSQSGTLRVQWQSSASHELHLWLLLCDPRTLQPEDLHPSRLLRELIRIPLSAEACDYTLYVPIERPLGLALVARDRETQMPVAAPSFEVSEAPSVRTRPAPPAPPAEQAPSRPVTHPKAAETAPRGYTNPLRETPLIFARPLSSTKPVTPERSEGGAASLSADPHFASLAKRLSSSFDVPHTPTAPRPQGFGLKQRWTLTRLRVPLPAKGPRVLLYRSTFISADQLAQAQHTLPPDAIALFEGCDGIIDALTPDEATSFYAVLELTPSGYLPLTLTLDNPPFLQPQKLAALGDPQARLAALDSPPQASSHYEELLAQARASAARALPLDR